MPKAGFLPYFEPQGSTPRVWQETAEPRDFNATYDRPGPMASETIVHFYHCGTHIQD